MSMVDENHTAPTPSPNDERHNKTDVPRGRALNFTSNVFNNGVSMSNTSFHNKDMDDLSDVSIDDEEEEMHIPHITPMVTSTNGKNEINHRKYFDSIVSFSKKVFLKIVVLSDLC